jgi:F-type H+-transporting ATPase subunit delta
MISRTTLARPYARAAFQAAHDADSLGEWSERLTLAAAIAAAGEMRELIDNPRIGRDRLIEVFRDVGAEKFDDRFINFLRTIGQNNRFELLPEIAAQFEYLRREAQKRIHVRVTSAYPLESAEQDNLAERLRKRFDREVDLEVDVDPSLIGGVIIRAGDEVIDGSVRGRLEQLGKQLAM